MLTNHLRRRCLESAKPFSRIWSVANYHQVGRPSARRELGARKGEDVDYVAPRGAFLASTSARFGASFHRQAAPKLAASSAVVDEALDAGPSTGSLNHRLPRVNDKTVELTVVDLQGHRQSYKARLKEGMSLLGALKHNGVDTGCHCALYDKGLEVCMGNCHVEIADEWLPKFPPRSAEELDVLEDHAPGQITRHSRLSCLLPLTKEHDGIVVSITEEIPWDIP